MNQDLAQVRVAALADSIQPRLATGRMLLRQQPHPGRELPPLAEGCAVTDGGHDRGCNQRSDARDLPQSPTRSIARSDPFHFVVHLDDLKLQVLPLAPQHGDQVPHPRGEVLVDVLKHLRQSFPQPNRALGEHDAALQQKRTNLVNQSSSSRHKAVTHAMESLQVELIICLDRHEAHVLAFHGLGDGFSIDEIVLVRLHKRLHELGWNQLHIMALFP